MQFCKDCDELLSEGETQCTSCGSEDFGVALECVHCGCWVEEDDMDRNQLCGDQGNSCQYDEEILDATEAKTIGLIMNLSQVMLKGDKDD